MRASIIINMSVLRIPEAKALELLVQRITTGRNLLTSADTYPMRDIPHLERTVEEWSDFNRAWLDKYLGGEASQKYRIASTHPQSSSKSNDLATQLAVRLGSEIEALEWIARRLPLWVPLPQAGSTDSRPRASRDAPIFIVHGSDTLRAESVALAITSATGRKTIILRNEPNSGRTLIEKFEQHAAEVSYAIIVLTADDKGSRADETDPRPRGRQNVIFEMGYFFGLVGRRNVSVLLRPGVEKPSDMDGIAYITFDDDRAWKTELFRELKHAGFDIDL